MSASFTIFDVHRVEISAHSACLSNGQSMHYQRMEIFNTDGWKIGEIVLHLEQPLSAIAIGDFSDMDSYQIPAIATPAALPAPDLYRFNGGQRVLVSQSPAGDPAGVSR